MRPLELPEPPVPQNDERKPSYLVRSLKHLYLGVGNNLYRVSPADHLMKQFFFGHSDIL